MNIHDLDTPALLIDLDIMERNLGRMADYVRTHGLRLRPHTKTHKIPALARQQMALGAAGLTVAKVSEAEVMLGSAPSDILDVVVRDLTAAGFPPATVSGGSTPTLFHSHKVRNLNEIRPGTYIFNDRNTVLCGATTYEDCAATVMVTVVSKAVKGQMII